MISTKKTLYKITQVIASITLASLGIHISLVDPTSGDGNDGDIWIKYTA